MAADVNAYLAQFPPKVRASLNALRKTIRSVAPEAEEKLSYGIVTFWWNGGLVGCGATKTHCALYVMSTHVPRQFAAELDGRLSGKSTVRFTPEKPLPVALVKKLVKARMTENVE
jgi:uncharacterized protein YdhG (YjbR/CyaY superfamily)